MAFFPSEKRHRAQFKILHSFSSCRYSLSFRLKFSSSGYLMPIYVLTDINSFVSFPVPAIQQPSNNSLFLAGILCFLQGKYSLYCAATSLQLYSKQTGIVGISVVHQILQFSLITLLPRATQLQIEHKYAGKFVMM